MAHNPGFGKYHIEGKHGALPPHEDFQETINLPEPQCRSTSTFRWVCANEELSLIVVYSTGHDRRSNDNYPFGIITAYYYLPCLSGIQCEPPLPGKVATKLTYTGPTAVTNGSTATLRASLTDDLGIVLPQQSLRFVFGNSSSQECTAMTDQNGDAACSIAVNQPPGTPIPVTVNYAGNPDALPSSTSTTIALQTPTTLRYTGPSVVPNGEPVVLSAVLQDFLGVPVAGRTINLAIGTGATQQSCAAITIQDGTGKCSITDVRQPLNNDATVGLAATFSGDDAYLTSATSATLRLRHFTGQAYGLSAAIRLPLLSITIPPQPNTGPIRTAGASNTTPPCTANVNAVAISAQAVCASFVTTLNPGTVEGRASVQKVTIGLPALPVIVLSGVNATATARCGSVTGSATLTATVGGVPIVIPAAPNSTVNLPGGMKLIVNEQTPVNGAQGLTVTAARVVLADGLSEVVVAHTTSAVHYCL